MYNQLWFNFMAQKWKSWKKSPILFINRIYLIQSLKKDLSFKSEEWMYHIKCSLYQIYNECLSTAVSSVLSSSCVFMNIQSCITLFTNQMYFLIFIDNNKWITKSSDKNIFYAAKYMAYKRSFYISNSWGIIFWIYSFVLKLARSRYIFCFYLWRVTSMSPIFRLQSQLNMMSTAHVGTFFAYFRQCVSIR